MFIFIHYHSIWTTFLPVKSEKKMLCIFAHSLVGIFRINSSVFELQRFDAQPIQNIASNALYDWMAQSVWFNTMHLIYWRSVCVRSIPSSIMPDQLINVLCTSIPMILLLFSIFFHIDDQLPCYNNNKQIRIQQISHGNVYFLHQLNHKIQCLVFVFICIFF